MPILRALATAAVVLAATTHGGCSCSDDGGTTGDAGVTDDGGALDAGGEDAGPMDGGTEDAGMDDAGPTDAGTEDAGTPDAGPTAARSAVFQSSGGGVSESSGYRLRVSVGAPQPMGRASGSGNQIVTGPAAARP